MRHVDKHINDKCADVTTSDDIVTELRFDGGMMNCVAVLYKVEGYSQLFRDIEEKKSNKKMADVNRKAELCYTVYTD